MFLAARATRKARRVGQLKMVIESGAQVGRVVGYYVRDVESPCEGCRDGLGVGARVRDAFRCSD